MRNIKNGIIQALKEIPFILIRSIEKMLSLEEIGFPPLIESGKVVLVSLNYKHHVKELKME